LGGTVTPSQVTFNQRTQTLSANLAGLNCTADLTTGVITCTDPEVIGLLLSTMSANGFNFLVQTPGAGVYQVQLGIALEASAITNSPLPAGANATVAVAAGSLVEMIVQAQTPFDTIKLCNGGAQNAGAPAPCGPAQ